MKKIYLFAAMVFIGLCSASLFALTGFSVDPLFEYRISFLPDAALTVIIAGAFFLAASGGFSGSRVLLYWRRLVARVKEAVPAPT